MTGTTCQGPLVCRPCTVVWGLWHYAVGLLGCNPGLNLCQSFLMPLSRKLPICGGWTCKVVKCDVLGGSCCHASQAVLTLCLCVPLFESARLRFALEIALCHSSVLLLLLAAAGGGSAGGCVSVCTAHLGSLRQNSPVL